MRMCDVPLLISLDVLYRMEHKLTNSLDLLIGPDSRADIDSEYSDTLNNSKNRGFLKGMCFCLIAVYIDHDFYVLS